LLLFLYVTEEAGRKYVRDMPWPPAAECNMITNKQAHHSRSLADRNLFSQPSTQQRLSLHRIFGQNPRPWPIIISCLTLRVIARNMMNTVKMALALPCLIEANSQKHRCVYIRSCRIEIDLLALAFLFLEISPRISICVEVHMV